MDGSPRYFLDYRALNNRMRAKKFPFRKSKEVTNNMAGSKTFSQLYMFAGYWKLNLADGSQEGTVYRCKCVFPAKLVKSSGYILSEYGISYDREKAKFISQSRPSQSKKEPRSFQLFFRQKICA